MDCFSSKKMAMYDPTFPLALIFFLPTLPQFSPVMDGVMWLTDYFPSSMVKSWAIVLQRQSQSQDVDGL